MRSRKQLETTMGRRPVDVLSQFLTRRRRRVRIRPKPFKGVVKVNLGSSLTVAEGWTNIDAGLHAFFARWPRAVLRALYRKSGFQASHTADQYTAILRNNAYHHHDLRYGIPLHDGAADFLLSSHFLEHLFIEEAPTFAMELFRVLKPGGIARITVPDLEIALEWHRQGDKEHALRLFYVPMGWGYYAQHRWMYDFEQLESLLLGAGFTSVVRCQYRQGVVPDLDVLDVMPEQGLYVEATKARLESDGRRPGSD